MSFPDKIGVAIVGTSRVGNQHAAAWSAIPEAQLVGVWGSESERTKNFAKQFKIRAYDSLEELLSDQKVKVVDIIGKHNQHALFGIQAAKAQKHVIVEKPLDASLEAANELVEQCRENQVYLATVFQHRYDEAIKTLKRTIEEGQLGLIFSANVSMSHWRSQEYYEASGGWRGKKELAGGGVLINQAIHIIDSLVFLFGEAATVYGETETLNHDIEVEDLAVGVIRFRNNILATINVTVANSASTPDYLEIVGTEGSARLCGQTLTLFKNKEPRLIRFKNKITNKLERYLPVIFSAQKKFKAGYHKENLSEIIEAIKANGKPPVSFAEGLSSLEIVSALVKSAKEKKLISLRPPSKKTFDRSYSSKLMAEAKLNKPKVLIINPLNENKSNANFSHIGKHRLRQPLGLAYINAFLKKITDTQLVDAAILSWDVEKTIQYINLIKPEILIISSDPLDRWQNPDLDISSVFNIVNLADVKHKILVGAHGSVTPVWIFKNCKADFVVRGEPEKTCFELVGKLISGNSDFEEIAGLSWRNKNKVFNNPNRIFDSNLDEYPLPDYDSLPMHLYRYTTTDLPRPFSLMLTSRGCPGQCVFCLKKMMPDKYRARSAEKVYQEIKYLSDEFAIKSIYFQDWEFLIDKERIKNLCTKIIDDKSMDVKWGCSARASSLDPEIIRLMKKAGCVMINFGFESGSEEILKRSRKGVSLEKVREVVQVCRQEKISLRPFCLVNLPGETKETLKESARFIVKNNLEIPHINIPIPYPGTRLAEAVNIDSWDKALSLSGKVGTIVDPQIARKLLRKYIWQGKFGFFYFLNPKFWFYSLDILRRKFLI